eukprot:CFRG1635T1
MLVPFNPIGDNGYLQSNKVLALAADSPLDNVPDNETRILELFLSRCSKDKKNSTTNHTDSHVRSELVTLYSEDEDCPSDMGLDSRMSIDEEYLPVSALSSYENEGTYCEKLAATMDYNRRRGKTENDMSTSIRKDQTRVTTYYEATTANERAPLRTPMNMATEHKPDRESKVNNPNVANADTLRDTRYANDRHRRNMDTKEDHPTTTYYRVRALVGDCSSRTVPSRDSSRIDDEYTSAKHETSPKLHSVHTTRYTKKNFVTPKRSTSSESGSSEGENQSLEDDDDESASFKKNKLGEDVESPTTDMMENGKRKRRKVQELDKRYPCTRKNCNRRYASVQARYLHVRLKHRRQEQTCE